MRITEALMMVAVVLGGLTPARADRIHFKNGEILEGIVDSDSATAVDLNIGVGSLTLAHAQIASIDRATSNETAALRTAWKHQYFSHARFAPPDLLDLATAYNELESRRRIAVDAQAFITRTQVQHGRQMAELQSLQDQSVALSRQIKEASPDQDPTNYNALIRQGNELGAQAIVLRDTIQRDAKAIEQQRPAIPDYLGVLHDFTNHLAARRGSATKDDDHAIFFEEVDRHLAGFQHDFEEIEVPYENEGGHVVVTAVLNERVHGRFLLDTGATYLTMSDLLAHSLQLDTAAGSRIQLTTADGRKVEARPVMLSSVQVADAHVSNVVAAVVDTSPAEGLDGLLGMSFLREFLIRLDPARQTLILEKFTPP